MDYFTADLHLGHRRIIELAHRPFTYLDEMDDTLISNINSRVGKSDHLYVIGDFALKNPDDPRPKLEVTRDYRQQIICPKVSLIRGNHDTLSEAHYREIDITLERDVFETKRYGQRIVLCHYAMRRWPNSHRGSWCLYGHSHGQLADDPTLLSFDVGVDCHNYQPLSFEEVQQKMKARTAAYAAPNHPEKSDPGFGTHIREGVEIVRDWRAKQ